LAVNELKPNISLHRQLFSLKNRQLKLENDFVHGGNGFAYRMVIRNNAGYA